MPKKAGSGHIIPNATKEESPAAVATAFLMVSVYGSAYTTAFFSSFFTAFLASN